MQKWFSGALAGFAMMAASAVAHAQTFTWNGDANFNSGTQTFGALTANRLDLNTTSGATLNDNYLNGGTTFTISLLEGGSYKDVYSTTVASGGSLSVNSIPLIMFTPATVTGIRFTSAPTALLDPNYTGFSTFLNLFGTTTFTFSNVAVVATPGPVAGTGLLALLALGGAVVARRKLARAA